MDEKNERRENRYLKFKKSNPDVSFAAYLARGHFRNLTSEREHTSGGALAVALGDPAEFWQAGQKHAEKLMLAAALRPEHKVIEYGCGTLRLGAHFIRHLDANCFLGLDVIDGYYNIGRKMLGDALLEKKRPRFHVISEQSLAEAKDFGAQLVYSSLVCVHVHPDETETYFRNLARLAGQPGARLIFNAELFEKPLRLEFNCWAWPQEFYEAALPEFTLARATIGRPRIKGGEEVRAVEFEFQRKDISR